MTTIAAFNCEWRGTESSGAAEIRCLVSPADVVCLTEAYRDFFLNEGHMSLNNEALRCCLHLSA